jgi:hypothetical protein
MRLAKWSVTKAAAFGAFLSVALLVARPLLLDESLPNTASSLVFYLFGGAISGAFLFAVVAAIRNFFVQ